MNRLERSSINMIASGAGYITPMLVNIVSTPFLLNGLGEAGYGLQNLVGVVTGYLALMDMGLDIPICKFLSEDHARSDTERQNHLLNTTLQAYFLIGLLGMVVIVVSADFLARRVFMVPAGMVGQAREVFLLAGVGFLANVLMMWGRAVFAGMQRYSMMNGVAIASNLLGVGIGLGVVNLGYGVVEYVFVRVSISLLAAASYWLLATRSVPGYRLHWGLDRETVRRVREYIGSGVLLRVSGLLTNGLDRTLIGVWLGVAAVGVYAIPLLVVNSFSALVSSMLGFTFPLASELYGTGQLNKLRDIFVRASRFSAALATLIFVPLLVLGDSFLVLWIKSGTAAQAFQVLRLLALAAYLGTLAVTLSNNIAMGTGHIRLFTVYALVRAGVVSGGYLFLIRPLGIEGAGWAALAANVVEWSFFILVVRRYLGLEPGRLFVAAYLKPVLLGLLVGLMGLIAHPLAATWLGLATVACSMVLSYVVLGYKIRLFGETEKQAAVALLRVVVSPMLRARGQA
ncbi:MAG: oligosaccharide flippase family protein [Chloroflexi bacterium]|nr:oligosaccharide flippase family protein [Chloroflexota bacterium]